MLLDLFSLCVSLCLCLLYTCDKQHKTNLCAFEQWVNVNTHISVLLFELPKKNSRLLRMHVFFFLLKSMFFLQKSQCAAMRSLYSMWCFHCFWLEYELLDLNSRRKSGKILPTKICILCNVHCTSEYPVFAWDTSIENFLKFCYANIKIVRKHDWNSYYTFQKNAPKFFSLF